MSPPQSGLRVTAVTCAKDEGPFILEWIAYHRLIGFTDIIVFTNDCSDGTDDLLDRLDEMGLAHHLPNPRLIKDSLRFQAAALRFASQMRQVRTADWRLSFDSDEFVQIEPGQGHVADLVESCANAELISICQLQHGCSNKEEYTPGLSIEQFQLSQDLKADPESNLRRDMERGLKTFVSGAAPITEWNNHKPEIDLNRARDVRWVYGENIRVPQSVINEKPKSLPVEGCYQLGQLNHYATRSMESFLVQSHRGNAVKLNEQADAKYWKRYNHNAIENGKIMRHAEDLRALMDDWLADAKLRRCQAVCESRHRALITQLKDHPDYRALYDRVRRINNRRRKQTTEMNG